MMKNIAISIPTGIGAAFGGYAGDFGCIAREFSKHFYTIVNPNAVNGCILSAINYNMGYLEGYLFDEFFKGTISITPKKQFETNKIGVIFDSGIKKDVLNVHLNTISALKMVQGIETVAIEYTKKPVGVEILIENNISSGSIQNPDTIVDASYNLIKKGAEAIAIVCDFHDDQDDENYANAQGIDPIGGVEAVISHLITSEFLIPAAHAPAFNNTEISKKLEHPKVAAECISSTYLPCIMQGLAIAPKICKNNKGEIANKNIEFLLTPYDALGSKAVLSAVKRGIKVVGTDNKTSLNVTADKLNINIYEEYKDYMQWLKSITK